MACFALLLSEPLAQAKEAEPSVFDPEAAIAHSQKAVGRVVGEASFLNSAREPVSLTDFRGHPLVINLVFTSCVQSCPVIVQSLARAVDVAQEALEAESFSVITVGFDSADDTPERMRAYARGQGIDQPNWHFLSGDPETLEQLLEDLGFLYFPSPRGFDHLAQTSVLDANGRVYQQVYGANFDPPAVVEPLKSLLFGDLDGLTSLNQIVDRIRLFCTFYDPARDRYSFDYSFFIMLIVGGLSLAGLATVLIRAWLLARPPVHRA